MIIINRKTTTWATPNQLADQLAHQKKCHVYSGDTCQTQSPTGSGAAVIFSLLMFLFVCTPFIKGLLCTSGQQMICLPFIKVPPPHGRHGQTLVCTAANVAAVCTLKILSQITWRASLQKSNCGPAHSPVLQSAQLCNSCDICS